MKLTPQQIIDEMLVKLHKHKEQIERGEMPAAVIFISDSPQTHRLKAFAYGTGQDVFNITSSGLNRQFPQEALTLLMDTIKERLDNEGGN